MTPPFSNSYWLDPDRILCGKYPRDFDALEDHEGMGAILSAGEKIKKPLSDHAVLRFQVTPGS